jgi:pyruvate/2-oxoglutarate dehydrogenase complex dihydrolipoamide dehydrogenase (E3) component
MERLRIVIIGGGPGGYEAALVAAEAGADVTIVSREGLGGNSVLWDCVPSKALVVVGEAMGWTAAAHRLGVRYQGGGRLLDRASVDMGAVMDRIAGLAGSQSADIAKKVEEAGARIVTGTGHLAGPEKVEVETADGTSALLPADVVLVATGSRPRTLPFSRPDGVRVFTSRELFNLRELPEELVVIGSGVTGAEYAHAFARLGSNVHLISSRDQILPSEDPDAAAIIEDSFEQWGMTIHRKRRAVGMERDRHGVRVQVGDEEWVEGTHALWCIGQVPQTGRLGLQAAGVEVSENGSIPVDAVSRTNIRSIYAAGDVTGRIMLASVAAMQGRTAMWHALGSAVAPLRWDAIASNIFTDPEVATVGMTAAEAAASTVPVQTVRLNFTGNSRAKMAENTTGFVKIHAMEGSGTILGGAVVADRASDLIPMLSLAVHNRLTVSQVAQTFTVYPSMSGSIAEAARLLMGRLSPVQ